MKKDHPTKQQPRRPRRIPAYSLSVETVDEYPDRFVVRVWRQPAPGSKAKEVEVARMGMTADFIASVINVGLGKLAEAQARAAQPAALVSPEGEKLL